MLNAEAPAAPATHEEAKPRERSVALSTWLGQGLRLWWRFPRLLRTVRESGGRQMLIHRGCVVGALIPASELERLLELDRREAGAVDE